MATGAEELAAAGRDAARRVWREGVKAQIDDPFDVRFARAAIEEFGRLQRDETPGIIRDALEGAAMAGEQLDVEPFHGVVEVFKTPTMPGRPSCAWRFGPAAGAERSCSSTMAIPCA